MPRGLLNDFAHLYMNELTSRIVAKSGIPSDRFHLGKIVLQSLKEDPDFVLQIDGATGESETSGETLQRTVQCANALRQIGVKQGDIIVLMAPNHLDAAIPFYAALYLGVIVAAIDRNLTINELPGTFSKICPKVVFCQSEKAPEIQQTLSHLNLDSQIVTFDKSNHLNFSEFLVKYGAGTAIEDFKPADFDPEETIAFLLSTSGSTGLPKSAAMTHKNFAVETPYVWIPYYNFPSPVEMILCCAPMQWVTATISLLGSVVMKVTRIQSSRDLNRDHLCQLINKYKPQFTMISPTMVTILLKPGQREQCDFTCFDIINLCGSAVPQNLFKEMQQIAPDTVVKDIFGLSEVAGHVFCSDTQRPGSCGKLLGMFQCRIVDIETNQDITEPNVNGELWLKGPTVFKEYYKDPEITSEAFAKDRWYKTGDMFYRDADWNFYFVERIKMLLKYKSYQISPVELEDVIRQHPGVAGVAVSGVPDPECGDLVVACVVRKPETQISAQEIKDLVADTLADSKRLRGGVIFVKAIPLTASMKVDRKKLKHLVLSMARE